LGPKHFRESIQKFSLFLDHNTIYYSISNINNINCIKEKGKTALCHCGPGTRPKLAREHSPARAARAAPPLTQTLTGGSRPSASPSTSRRRSGDLQLNTGELPASAARRASFPSSLRTRRPSFHPLSPTLAPATTGTADGHLGRANAGRPRRVERELSDAKALGAHRDFNRARSGNGESRSDAGHDGARPRRGFGRVWGRTDRVEDSGELELALGGAIDC
jgi:hypothetical protein